MGQADPDVRCIATSDARGGPWLITPNSGRSVGVLELDLGAERSAIAEPLGERDEALEVERTLADRGEVVVRDAADVVLHVDVDGVLV